MRIQYWALAAFVCSMNAQPTRSYRIDSIAGSTPNNEGVLATTAVIDSPLALAVGKDGVIFIGSGSEGIRRISGDGIISHIPGAGLASGIAVDSNGTLSYIFIGPELYTQVANSQTVTTTRPTDGVISARTLTGVAVDTNGNVLIADQDVRRILRVNPTGTVTVVAGTAGTGSRIPLTAAPSRLAVDALNNIYIAQTDQRITRLSPDGTLTVVAGNGGVGVPVIGAQATASPFGTLGAVAVTPRGEIFVVDRFYRRILKINTGGTIESAVQNVDVFDMALDVNGNLLFAEYSTGKIWQLHGDGTQTLIAGRDRFGGDGGPATMALLKTPGAVAVNSDGTLFIGDTGNNRIRKVSVDGVITTVAGNGVAGSAGDGGPATMAQVLSPDLLTIDKDGNLYISCQSCSKVRRLKTDGRIETVAGTGAFGDSGDGGAATAATFESIGGLALDRAGRVFVSDTAANRVRVINLNGTISAYAGTGEHALGGEGMPAISSPLSDPSSLALDSAGNLLVNESGRLRRITPSGIITTWSQTLPQLGTPGNSESQLCYFIREIRIGLGFDLDGSLLVGGSNVICRLMPDGTSWLVAGGLHSGFAGDGGPATSALLLGPSGLVVDATGTIFFADTGNYRVRRLQRDNPGGSVALVPAIHYIHGAGASSSPVMQLSPGGLSSIYGTDFAGSGTAVGVQNSDLVNRTLPIKLANTCVQVGGLPAFLLFVGSRQINFQVPDVPVNATVNVQVIANCGTGNEIKSGEWPMSTQSATPELLYWINDGRQNKPVVAVNAISGAYIGPPGLISGLTFTPARPGDLLTLYCISLGATKPPIPSGLVAAVPAQTVGTLPIHIGRMSLPAANVLYVGVTPGTAGLYQINIRLPDLPDGDQQILVGGSPQDGFIPVKN